MRRMFKVVGFLAIMAIFATAAYAFTAQNTFSGPNSAGDGSDTINGYTVSSVHYTLKTDTSGNSVITQVSFALSPDSNATQVSARLQTGSNTYSGWESCSAATPPSTGPWTCDFSSAPVSTHDAIGLEVAAAQ